MLTPINGWCLYNRRQEQMLYHCPDHPLRAQLLSPGSMAFSAFSPVICLTKREASAWADEWNQAFDDAPDLAVRPRRLTVLVQIDEPTRRSHAPE